MITTLLNDTREHPKVFRWNGPVRSDRVLTWMTESDLVIPCNLLELWQELGGGDLFESETIFEPVSGADDIDVENTYLIKRGLPSGLLAMHRGIYVTAIDQRSAEIVVLDPVGFRERARFGSIDSWYRVTVRAEFSERYGLSSA